jgi:hypothetical protein
MRKHSPKQEMSPMTLQRLKARIWQMPWIDRVEILSLSIIEREREALACSLGLAAMITKVSTGCGVTNKARVAETLRNLADELDHELQKEVV